MALDERWGETLISYSLFIIMEAVNGAGIKPRMKSEIEHLMEAERGSKMETIMAILMETSMGSKVGFEMAPGI